MDVNEELKFCENSKKKFFLGGGGGRVGGGVRVDVNEALKFLRKFKKRYCTILRKLKQVARRATMLT